jgi:hypothetical protein
MISAITTVYGGRANPILPLNVGGYFKKSKIALVLG